MSSGGDGTRILPLELDALVFEAQGTRVVDDLSLRFEAGSCSVILGPNGAGKSLTLRMAHGLLAPSSGSVRWCGPGARAARRRQAMVFERPVLLRRSVAANIDWALRVHRVPRPERRARIERVLDRTGLAGLARQAARTLSAGEQQRLSLARAWALDPQVLFLDEPTASLDPAATRRIEELIEAIAATGTKIVMTTHDLGQARRLADDIVLLHRGRLLERSAASDFFDEPASAEGRAFLQGDLLG